MPLSPTILAILLPFAHLFSRPVWNNALTLLVGAILLRGKRTICAILRIMGKSHEDSFAKYHHVLNRVNWSPLAASRTILTLLLNVVGLSKPLVMFIDETLERRKGKKIKAKGYYRDAVRSSKNTVVKCSGLKWLTIALSWRFPFSARCFALPFITVLEPSEKCDRAAKRRHKTTLDWTIQLLKQVKRWLTNATIILVGDGGFASGKLAWTCIFLKITLISRLKMNARIYAIPPPNIPGKRGRKRAKGTKLITFKEMINMPDLGWQEVTIRGYGKKEKRIKYLSNTCLWGVEGVHPVPIRWVLVVDPAGDLDPLPLMCTDVMLSSEQIIEFFIQRWNLEVTFEEVREHLGVETQRQWSDKAIVRTTPILLGLYTIICLISNRLHEEHPIEVAQTAWYEKQDATFSDLIRSVRTVCWRDSLISRKGIFECFRKNSEGQNLESLAENEPKQVQHERFWIKVLVEHLAAA